MKVTTVRFGRDLWRLLESEANLVGTSVSQYIREAALARAAAAASLRGDSPFEALASAAESPADTAVVERARQMRQGAKALRAQSRQVTAEAKKKARRAAEVSRH
jgi:hypothetical protein